MVKEMAKRIAKGRDKKLQKEGPNEWIKELLNERPTDPDHHN